MRSLFCKGSGHGAEQQVSERGQKWDLQSAVREARSPVHQKIQDAFKLLNTFLEGQDYVARDHLSVADIALVAYLKKYPNITQTYF